MRYFKGFCWVNPPATGRHVECQGPNPGFARADHGCGLKWKRAVGEDSGVFAKELGLKETNLSASGTVVAKF